MSAFSAWQSEVMARHVPLHALFEITERCNYACSHCYLPHRGDDELTTAEACALLDQLADAGSLFLTLTGGEVFLRRDFLEIARHARARDFALRIFTNGWFVDDGRADALARLDPMGVEISLYGPDAASFEAVTEIAGSFERTTAAIRRLTARGVRVIAKTPVTRLNARRLAETERLATSLGAGFKWDALISPMDGGESRPLAWRASTEDLLAVYAWERTQHDAVTEAQPDPRLLGVPPRGAPPSGGPPVPPTPPLDAAPCNAGRGSVAISPRGDVYACIAIKEPAGNVRERPFAEIWRGGPLLDAVRGISIGSLRECATCDDRPWCSRCMGVARHETGSLLEPSPEACRLAAARRAAFEGRAPSPARNAPALPIVY